MLLLGAVVAVLLLVIGVFTSIWVVVLGLVLIGAGAALLDAQELARAGAHGDLEL